VYPDATGAILQEMEDAVHVEVRPLRVSRVVQPCGSMQKHASAGAAWG
jgi:hypothetical protein